MMCCRVSCRKLINVGIDVKKRKIYAAIRRENQETGSPGGIQFMSSQISCNGTDRENRMHQLYEELQLLPAELC